NVAIVVGRCDMDIVFHLYADLNNCGLTGEGIPSNSPRLMIDVGTIEKINSGDIKVINYFF
ncbi:hypothetical protein ACJX0J_027670, partial [Zea mays]